MERKERHFKDVWKVQLMPASCGIRILSLDGYVIASQSPCAAADIDRGGVRGIVELEILRRLSRELGDGLNVQDFFDLIVGTRYFTSSFTMAGTR